MANLHEVETFATGMVRPKTTALFFDKLWIHPALIEGFQDQRLPDNSLEPYRVPSEFCVNEPLGAYDYYDSFATQSAYTASRSGFGYYTDVAEALKSLNAETWDLASIFLVESGFHFKAFESPLWEQLKERFDYKESHAVPEDIELSISTENRNKAIQLISELYAARGKVLTPVFLAPSEYDQVTAREREGLAVCLDNVPCVAEDELTWKQVREVRKDKKARKRLERLRRWFSIELVEKTEGEIADILGKRLDDYEWALKKHGLKTTIAGSTSVIPFAVGTAASPYITGSPLYAAAGGLALASGAVLWVASILIDRADIQRDEVAYIYDVQRLGSK